MDKVTNFRLLRIPLFMPTPLDKPFFLRDLRTLTATFKWQFLHRRRTRSLFFFLRRTLLVSWTLELLPSVPSILGVSEPDIGRGEGFAEHLYYKCDKYLFIVFRGHMLSTTIVKAFFRGGSTTLDQNRFCFQNGVQI